MSWLLIIGGGALLLFAAAAMSRRGNQQAAVRGLRREFPKIAFHRLVGTFPEIEPAIGKPMLRSLFDWTSAKPTVARTRPGLAT